MKIKTIKYSMLRVTKPFENDRAEIEIELDAKDQGNIDSVVATAKLSCQAMLDAQVVKVKIPPKEQLTLGQIRDQLRALGRCPDCTEIPQPMVGCSCYLR